MVRLYIHGSNQRVVPRLCRGHASLEGRGLVWVGWVPAAYLTGAPPNLRRERPCAGDDAGVVAAALGAAHAAWGAQDTLASRTETRRVLEALEQAGVECAAALSE
eukprot:2931386-Pleurochrysis_carterae.AAC.1